MKTAFSITALLCLLVLHAFPQISITADAAKPLKTLTGHEAGINLNYLMDGGFTNPATSTAAALKNMGVKLLRYPGGEKSDNYLWSAAPWKAASPRMALRDTANAWPTEDNRFVDKTSPEKLSKPVVLDFDELMPLCKTVGAEPLIVVAYDAMYNTKTAVRPTKAQLLANAAEWVRYANITKKFGIKYWMIGNESWNHPDYNGRTTPEQYAADLAEFATAMKGVDPTIKIIANGRNDWWPTLLQSPAVSLLDILAFSLYPAYNFTNGYETYRTTIRNLTSEIDDAVQAIATYAPEADKARLKVLAAEYNSIDFDGGWSNENNLGHALCNFQIFGDMVVNPKVESACLWNTRWTTNETEEQHLFDALDKNGKLNATGTAQQVWARNLLHTMIKTTSDNDLVQVYASYDTVTRNLNFFLLNKDTADQNVSVSLANYSAAYSGSRHVFGGTSVNDKFPTFKRIDTIGSGSDKMALMLPAASVTVLKLVPGASRLTLFTGALAENKATLTWQTENDFQWSYYAVERSTGSNNAFDSIGVHKVRTNGGFAATYTFSDTSGATNKTIYYRLKIVARNGTVRYSDTLSFVLTAVEPLPGSPFAVSYSIAPNPVGSSLQLLTQTGVPQSAVLQIVDAIGRVWRLEKVSIAAGTSTVTVNNLYALPRGIYWLQVAVAAKRQTLPFFKR